MAISTVKATINGETYTLTLDSSTGTYKATITAPTTSSYNNNSGHYYPVSITATDDAGNSTTVSDTVGSFNTNCQLKVLNTTAPTISLTYPSSGSTITTNGPTIKWTATDTDPGVDSSTAYITLDGTKITTNITSTKTTNGYTFSYTASSLSDGDHTVAFGVSDLDGNAATLSAKTFTVDTVPPTLVISSPSDDIHTNVSTVTVSGTTNDETSSPVTITINGTAVTVGSDGTFSKTVTLTEGTNTITIVATDSAGKTTTVTRTVTLNTSAPVFTSVTITPNPVDVGASYVIEVTVTDE